MNISPELQIAVNKVKQLRAIMNSKPIAKRKAYMPAIHLAVKAMNTIQSKERDVKWKAYHEEIKNVIVESEFEYLGPDIEPFDLGQVEIEPLEETDDN